MNNWQDEYKRKTISAEEAAKLVKSGDRVSFCGGREAFAVGLALASRMSELRDVRVFVAAPTYDFGWYDEGWQEAFDVVVAFATAVSQEALDARRCDYMLGNLFPHQHFPEFDNADVLLAEVSPPDDKGFCSFGASVWRKKQDIRAAKLAIAEVNRNLIRTYGDNSIHVSEIDYFVEHISKGAAPASGTLAGREQRTPPEYLRNIAQNVAELIKDGDTLQIGVGRATEPLVQLGMLDAKRDLGYHSEATPPGIIRLVQRGIINGKYKTLHPEKLVATSLGGSSLEEMQWVNLNPLFLLVDSEYLEDVRVIAAHDNMVAINQALTIDLEGQVGAESVGWRRVSMGGGQASFVIGALHSKGGRAITVIPSTAKNGAVSTIVPMFPQGTRVTVPAMFTDYVATEYGVAHLRGKSARKRAEELISIAHPRFRSELKREAEKLFWP